MKKLLLAVCLVLTLIGLSACGDDVVDNAPYEVADLMSKSYSYESYIAWLFVTCDPIFASDLIDNSEYAEPDLSVAAKQKLVEDLYFAPIKQGDEDALAQMETYFTTNGIKVKPEAIAEAMRSWDRAKEDIGELLIDYETQLKYSIYAYTDTMQGGKTTVNFIVKGSDHDASVECIYNDQRRLESMTINTNYSLAEKLERAVLNTVMGMGTAFAVLIIIMFIISLMGFIPKLQEKAAKKAVSAPESETSNETSPTSVAPEVYEDETDDAELVAVISAAIAASSGAVSVDGLVVKSIRRRNIKTWKSI